MQPLRWTANYLGIATYLRIFHVVNRNPCPFIASLPGLRYLAVLDILESGMKLVPQAHDAVFELSIFYGTPSGAASILPGRPVHHLLLTAKACAVKTSFVWLSLPSLSGF